MLIPFIPLIHSGSSPRSYLLLRFQEGCAIDELPSATFKLPPLGPDPFSGYRILPRGDPVAPYDTQTCA